MKKKFITIAAVCITLFIFLSACTPPDPTPTIYEEYNNLLNSEEYSFNVTYTDSFNNEKVYISCQKSGNEYAYRFSATESNESESAYRHIFSDNGYYEIKESKNNDVWSGKYKLNKDIKASDYDKNFMYRYTSFIVSNVYTDLMTEQSITYKEKSCTLCGFYLDGKYYEYIFDRNAKQLVKFALISDNNTIILEYSDYNFDKVDKEYFKKPDSANGYQTADKIEYEYKII